VGLDEGTAFSFIRISIGKYYNKQEMDIVIDAGKTCCEQSSCYGWLVNVIS
jgi:hypothetical protein